MKSMISNFSSLWYEFVPHSCSGKKRLVRLSCMLFMMAGMWLMGYKWRDTTIFLKNWQINNLTEKKKDLSSEIEKLESQLIDYNFMLEDGDWYRYLAYKHAEITVPKNTDPKHLKLLTEKAIENDIPLKYVYRLVWKESRFDPEAASLAGAKGYMQIVPSSFDLFKNRYSDKQYLRSLTTQESNIVIGTFMLSELHKKYGKWELAFAAYNAGSVVGECMCVPNIPETQSYVKFIMQKQ